jgi:hypothetical protein
MKLSAAYLKKKQEWKEEVQMEVQIEGAINFLRLGVSSELIAQAFRLPIQTIESLRDRV